MVDKIASVAIAVLVLAGVAVALKRGSQTASVIKATANGYANVIKAATGS